MTLLVVVQETTLIVDCDSTFLVLASNMTESECSDVVHVLDEHTNDARLQMVLKKAKRQRNEKKKKQQKLCGDAMTSEQEDFVQLFFKFCEEYSAVYAAKVLMIEIFSEVICHHLPLTNIEIAICAASISMKWESVDVPKDGGWLPETHQWFRNSHTGSFADYTLERVEDDLGEEIEISPWKNNEAMILDALNWNKPVISSDIYGYLVQKHDNADV